VWGVSLLRLLNRGNVLTPFQVNWFSCGTRHAGVLLLMSLLFYTFLDPTRLSAEGRQGGCSHNESEDA
jgi:hypothetical protein